MLTPLRERGYSGKGMIRVKRIEASTFRPKHQPKMSVKELRYRPNGLEGAKQHIGSEFVSTAKLVAPRAPHLKRDHGSFS